MKIDPADLISYKGIEEETGVQQSTLRTWVSRGVLPKPIRADLGPFWDRNVILPAVRARMAEDAG